MKKYSVFIIMTCFILLTGCGKSTFYDDNKILKPIDFEVINLKEKTNNIQDITKHIKDLNPSNYQCSIYFEKELEKAFIPVTQRNLITFSMNKNEILEKNIIHFFSKSYDYFESTEIYNYNKMENDTILNSLYVVSKFEETIKENLESKKTKTKEKDLNFLYPTYFSFFVNEQKENSNFIQLNDCKIEKQNYYHFQFTTNKYNSIIWGVDSPYFTKENTLFDYYINKDTFVPDYITIQNTNNLGKKEQQFISYLPFNGEIQLPKKMKH